jgi:hypothetical protein
MATMQEQGLKQLDTRYEIRNSREMFRNLAEYPELEPILIEAHAQILKHFGNDAGVILDFWRDIDEES